MILDLDTSREVARTPFSIAPGATRNWNFSYNVGPETYGRAIEVRFVDSSGKVLDSWQEYYVVAAEFFRVQQHAYAGRNKLYKAPTTISAITSAVSRPMWASRKAVPRNI